jgi:peptidase M50B-like protein
MSPPAVARRRTTRVLAATMAVTALLYLLPFGRTLAWPLVLISTLAHELGHGLAAVVLGGHFHALRIQPDASGVALWSGPLGRFATAAVAGAGLVGPAAAAFLLLVLGREPRRARQVLAALGAALCVVAILLARNSFGFGFTLLLGTAFLLVALRAPRASQTVVMLVAVQLGLSVFSRADYLFMPMALTPAGPMPSDVSVMAHALLLPYWFWGVLCGTLSVLLLFAGLRICLRR